MSALHSESLLLAAAFLPTVSLVIFLTLFVGIVIYVFVVPKSVWNKDAQLPLDNPKRAPLDKENGRG